MRPDTHLLYAFASLYTARDAARVMLHGLKPASGPLERALLATQASSAFNVQQMLTDRACTGCVLLANSAFVQASLLWITLTPIIFKFNRYCKLRFGEARVTLHPLENQ